MPRQRSPNRDKAFEIWQESGESLLLKDIAAQLGVSENQIRKWKNQDDWEQKRKVTLPIAKGNVTKRKSGGQPGNQNAVGNDGGAAPMGNKNAEKHGFFSKWLPAETLSIMQEIETKSPIDLLWDQIMIQYTAIIRAQQIMYVRDAADLSKEVSMSSDEATAWDVQQAWDKQAKFLQAQSRAMTTLNGMIKQYEELCRGDMTTEEQRARIDKLKADTKKIKGEDINQSQIQEFVSAVKPNIEDIKALFDGEDDEKN